MIARFYGMDLQPGDDLVFRDAHITYGSLSEAMKVMYSSWGGRVVILAIANLILRLPLSVVRVLLSALCVLLVYYMVRTACLIMGIRKDKSIFLVNAMASILLMLMSVTLFHSSILWYTGFFFYPLPLLAYFMGMLPFYSALQSEKIGKPEVILAVIGLAICPYMEQTAVLFLASAAVCMGVLIGQKKMRWEYAALFIWGMLHSIVQFVAPGNDLRSTAEQLKWFPGFDMLGNSDKFMMGLFHSAYTLFQNDHVIFLSILILLMLLGYKAGKIRLIWSFGLLFASFFIKKLVNGLVDDTSWLLYDTKYYVTLGVLIFWILLILFSLYDQVQDKLKAMIVTLYAFAAVMECVLIGFSPTVYASGARVVFFSYMLLLLVSCMLLGELLTGRSENK